MTTTPFSNMTRRALIDECRRLLVTYPGGLTTLPKDTLVQLATARQAELDEYNARVKPYKLVEGVDRGEINKIRWEAERSRVNIDGWRDDCIAEIESAEQDRLLAEFATHEEARDAADKRNATAHRGFCYYTEHIDATLAELRG